MSLANISEYGVDHYSARRRATFNLTCAGPEESVWSRSKIPSLGRALGVAGCLAVLFTLAASKLSLENARPAVSRLQRSAVASPIVAHRQDYPLDSDFNVDLAALIYAHLGGHAAPALRPGQMQFGSARVQRSIVERVVSAAKTAGADPVLMMSIADKESSFAPTAKASTSSASGLFQFIDTTWLRAMRAFGWRYGHEEEAKAIVGADERPEITPQKRAEVLNLRNDPYLAAALAAEMLKQDGGKIAELLGRPLTAGETYLVHFLGPDDAARFMKKLDEAPQTSAAQLLPRPARANKPIFYESRRGRMKDRSLSEVHEVFEQMMGQRLARYADVEAQLPAGVSAYAQ